MTDKDAATKLKERVSDWHTYLDKADHPWNDPPESAQSASDSAQTPVHVASSPPPAPAATAIPYAEVMPSVVEVAPAEVPPRTNGSTGVNSSTVVEVLPPDPRTLPAKTNGRKAPYPQRVRNEAPLKSILFNDQRQAEAEYDHARRANNILTAFIVILLAVLVTTIAW